MTPPRFADWLLRRVLPLGKRGDSILGDLHEEFRSGASRAWYWKQAIPLVVRYALAPDRTAPLIEYRRSHPMHDVISDLRTAWRMFVRTPGTSLLIVGTLALAIAAATIGFAFADLVLLRGIPADDPKVVVSIFASDTKGSNDRMRISALDYLAFRDRATSLERVSVMRPSASPAALITNGQSRTLAVGLISGDAMAALGQSALLGRAVSPGDDTPAAPKVVVLSHHYWRDEWHSRPNVIGETMQIGREFYTVVGVMAPGLEFGTMAGYDVWMPMIVSRESPSTVRDLRILARLKPGVSFAAAAAEIATIGDALAAEHPDTNGGWKARLVPVRALTGGDQVWIVIALFLLAVGLIMAIATANVSNLVMVRALARQRELAVRTALGARRGRIVRQFIVEGGALSFVAAAVAIPLCFGGLQIIHWIAAEPIIDQVAIDLHELSFIASLALICPVLLAIAPARAISRTDTRQALAASGVRGATASSRGHGWLVVAQISLAVILLMTATLSTRSVNAIYGKPTGIDGDGALALVLDFNDALYPDPLQAAAAARAAQDALSRTSRVTAAAMLSALPILGGEEIGPFSVDGRITPPGESAPMAVITQASPEAAAALGLQVVSGSWWTSTAKDVAVVSREAAVDYFGGVDAALGRSVSYELGATKHSARVIGVSSDVVAMDFSRPAVRIWVAMEQPPRRVTYLLRAAGDAAGLVADVRTSIAATAPAIPVENLETYTQGFARARSSDDVIVAVLAGFAGVALLLSSAGLFGVVSFGASQRTAEFGTRLALGASAADVIGLVARDSAKLLAIGLPIGLAGGIGVGFMMKSMLFGMSPADPMTLIGVVVLLTIVTVIATALPAWRASRIDPVVALRAD
jgi:putative ABC transport system permease protein